MSTDVATIYAMMRVVERPASMIWLIVLLMKRIVTMMSGLRFRVWGLGFRMATKASITIIAIIMPAPSKHQAQTFQTLNPKP